MKKKILNLITVLGFAVVLGVLFGLLDTFAGLQVHPTAQGVIVGMLCVLLYEYLKSENN